MDEILMEILSEFVYGLCLILAFFGMVHLMLRHHNRYEMQKLERKAEEMKLIIELEWEHLEKKMKMLQK